MFVKKFKFVALIIAVLLVLSCFSGCKGANDFNNTASDFIKVYHPATPNTNIFSDDDYTGPDNSSTGTDSSSGNSSTTDNSGDSADNPSDDTSSFDPANPPENGDNSGNNGNNGNLNDTPLDDDFGPIVEF